MLICSFQWFDHELVRDSQRSTKLSTQRMNLCLIVTQGFQHNIKCKEQSIHTNSVHWCFPQCVPPKQSTWRELFLHATSKNSHQPNHETIRNHRSMEKEKTIKPPLCGCCRTFHLPRHSLLSFSLKIKMFWQVHHRDNVFCSWSNAVVPNQ